MRHELTMAVGLTLTALMGTTATASGLSEIPLPNGVTEYRPGGETLCARGDPFAFFVLEGDSDKVIIDYIGGGACWDAETCDTENPTFTDTVDSVRSMIARGNLHGVNDLSNATNPYKGWTHVVVPYCTGDVHWGESDVTYKRANGTSFVIHHRGATNSKAVIDWVKSRYEAPANVLVTGCSAGSYGSIFWTPKVRETFPNATVRQFGDAGVGVLTESFMKQSLPLWNVTANAPSWIPALDPAKVDYTKLQLSDFYVGAAKYYPGVRFAQYTTAFDFIQTFFYVRMGGEQDNWTPGMWSSLASIQEQVPNFNSYVAAGDMHCATVEDDFYTIQSQGVKLHDWVSTYLSDAPLANVKCDQCESQQQ